MLGCLVEKQLTTPQQYPLTLNALTTAANQATNRDPVVDLSDDDVLTALDELRTERLIRVVLPSHGRSVKRYRHVLDEVYGLDEARYGLLAALLLRGPQTIGELRARTERMIDLPSLGDAQDQLTVLAEHPDGLVRLMPRRPGQKEERWQQILAGSWGPGADAGHGDGDGVILGAPLGAGDSECSAQGATRAVDAAEADPVADLRIEVAALRAEVSALHHELETLREGLGG